MDQISTTVIGRDQEHVFLIIGMHRSGTSLLSSLVNALGVSVGDNLYPPDESNPVGYFEDTACIDIQERMLAALGQPWAEEKGMLPFPPLWWRTPELAPLVAELEAWIDRRVKHSGRSWALKDPRTTRFLPMWQELLRARNLTVRYLLAVRDPAEVTASEVARDGVPAEQVYRTWLRYNMEALLHGGAELAGVFAYSDWFTDGPAQLRRLADVLGIVGHENMLPGILHKILRPELYRADGEGQPVPEWANSFYKSLHRLSRTLSLGDCARLAAEAEYSDALVRRGALPPPDGPMIAFITGKEGLVGALHQARVLATGGKRVVLGVIGALPEMASVEGVAVLPIEITSHTVSARPNTRSAYIAWLWLQARAYSELHFEGGMGLAAHVLDARRFGWPDEHGRVYVHYLEPPAWLDEDGRVRLRDIDDIEALDLEKRIITQLDVVLYADPPLKAILSAACTSQPPASSQTPDPSDVEPLISVCITHFNRPALLNDCLASVRAQTYRQIEVILVDDGSNKAGAHAYLNSLEAEFVARGWKLLRLENRYLGAARNAAVRAAAGEYVLILDDDNLLRPEGIAQAVQIAQRTGADIVTAVMAIFHGPPGSAPRGPDQYWVFPGGSALRAIFDNSIGDANALVRRALIEDLGGFTEDRGVGAEDWEFFSRAALHGAQIEHCLQPISWYRVDPAGMARSGNWWRDYRRALRPYEEMLPPGLRELPSLSGLLSRRVAKLETETAEELALAKDRAAAAEQDNAELSQRLGKLEAETAAQREAADRIAEELTLVKDRAAAAEQDNAGLGQRLAKSETEAAAQREAAARVALDLNAISASTTWRMTAPVRQALSRHPGLARWGRRSLKAAWWAVTGQLPARMRARSATLAGPIMDPTDETSAGPIMDSATDPAAKLPFRVVPRYIDPTETWCDPPASCRSRIGVHLHVFYFNLLEELINRLRSIPFAFDVFVSVPDFVSPERANQVERALREGLSRAEKILIRHVPNRGRDIAPFILSFGKVLLGYDIIGHFHTKASPHNPELVRWRDTTFDLLLGPTGNPGGHVAWIVGLLEENAKFVYPEGPPSLPRDPTGWAGNYAIARDILAKHSNFSIADFPHVEFAEGSMLWARAAALRGFLELPLSYNDFPPEPIGADGTLAHALERLIFILAQRAEGDLIRLHKGDSVPDYRLFEEAQDFSDRINHTDVKVLAYYLPQFHPIPENSAWHGAGFTEWTKVRAANPLFRGHYQQHIPHPDVGYYTIDSVGTLHRQAYDMKRAGVYGQIFYHYWFDGKLILERPAKILLENTDVDMSFCFCWANENWTKRWDGSEDDILLKQDYSADDAHAFIRYLIPFFKDARYLKVGGRPVLFIYRPTLIPMMADYLAAWREECEAAGLERPYIVAALTAGASDPREFAIDAGVERVLYDWTGGKVPHITSELDVYTPLRGRVFAYQSIKEHYAAQPMRTGFTYFRSLVPNWDNTARYGVNAHIVHGSTPRLFQEWLETLIAQTKRALPADRRFIVVNAWNEWAEGAHLEADTRYGYAYLNAVGRALANEPFGCPASDSFHGLAIARAAELARNAGAVLMVTHRFGGGTERHVEDMVTALAREGVVVFLMRVAVNRPNWVVIERAGAGEGPELGTFAVDGNPEDCARLLSRLHVRHVHVQHLAGYPDAAADWIQRTCSTAGVHYDVTLHDYLAICPRIVMTTPSNTYCAEPPLGQCESCIATNGSPFGRPSVVEWRARYGRLLSGARRRFVPNDDVAERLARYFPKLHFTVHQHPEPRRNTARLQALQSGLPSRGDGRPAASSGRKLHVAVIGHIDGHKGFDVLLNAAEFAQRTQAPIRFTVIGSTRNDSALAGLDNVYILGNYNPSEFLEIIERQSPDVAFLPSCCPETYSFTLTEAVAAGIYPVVFDLGAMAKRVRSLGWGTVLPTALMTSPEEVVKALLAIRPTAPSPAVFDLAQGVEYPSTLCDYYGLNWPLGMDGLPSDHRPLQSVSKARLRRARFAAPGREAALLVTHVPGGYPKPYVQRYASALAAVGIDVYLIVAADLWSQTPCFNTLRDIAGVFIRDNEGYDFAAWAHVLQENPEFKAVDILYLVNDSVIGPMNHHHFSSAVRRIRSGAAQIYGMTENYEKGWHLQSYFLAVKQPALRSRAFDEFFGSVVSLADKQAVIENYEISFASKMTHAGIQTEALFTLPSERNMTLYHWKELLCLGFPFVKVQIGRDELPGVDRSAVLRFLENAGYLPGELKAIFERSSGL